MTDYEKTVALWRRKNIRTDAGLAEALNSHSVAFAYHSGKIENENITHHDTRDRSWNPCCISWKSRR